MDEFFKNYFYILNTSFELIAALTAVFTYKKYKHTAIKYFAYFLVYVVVCEALTLYTFLIKDGILNFLEGTVFQKNYWFVNLYWGIGAPLFFMFFYLKLFNSIKIKKIVRALIPLFLISSIGTIVFNVEDYLNNYVVSNDILGALIILFVVTVYFYEILQSDKIITFHKSIYFYISSTVFIWVLITTPLVFYDMYFTTADWSFIILKYQFFLFSNMFMYLTFSLALLCCKPEKR
ncbi:hypothetical protein ACFFVB_16670 [Formosa undariae]|uniref:Histidine kinase N-terminal 7TM region domain-containing protein n=1 Tax=Formosa undariae TaxID=1325436 RepID=A0ABV5F5P9_9FLAO